MTGARKSIPTVETRDPAEIRKSVVADVLATADADVGLFYSLALVDGVLRVASWSAAGDPSGEKGIRDVAANPSLLPPAIVGAAFRPSPRETNAFVELDAMGSTNALGNSPYYRQVAARYQMVDQIRLLVFHGTRFVGWIGAFRHMGARRFARKDRRRLAPLIGTVKTLLTVADGLSRADLPGNAWLVARPDGIVDHATRSGEAWLARPSFRRAIIRTVRNADAGRAEPPPQLIEGAEARLVRLDGVGPVRYLVQLRSLLPVHSIPAGLTLRQRQVAEFAAVGATAREIAAELSCDPETVRGHLRRIYACLAVHSRAQLADRLARLPPASTHSSG